MTTNDNNKVVLINVSPEAEKNIAYCARVSNPNNQDNDSIAGLLGYCIKHKHWSIFEMAFMTLEINTTRGPVSYTHLTLPTILLV